MAETAAESTRELKRPRKTKQLRVSPTFERLIRLAARVKGVRPAGLYLEQIASEQAKRDIEAGSKALLQQFCPNGTSA